MKILLLAPDNRRRTRLINWLRSNNAVVAGVAHLHGIQILEEIARCNPHLVIFTAEQVTDRDTQAVLAFINQKMTALPLAWLPYVQGASDLPRYWTHALRKFLQTPIPPPLPRPYGHESRLVFHDPAFQDFSRADRIVTGSVGVERQCASLFCLLDGARQNHQRAKAYLATVEASLSGLEPELTYRLVHRSYKGLSWARDLAPRYAAVLAHYVPGVQLDYLPPPAPIHPSIDYVHYTQPPEARYALHVLSRMHIHESVAELLFSCGGWHFTGQSGVTLSAEQCQLFGLAGFMHQITRAHIAVMNRWLAPDQLGGEETDDRQSHRELGIVRDFWDLGLVFETAEMLPHLLRAYHESTWKPDFKVEPPSTYPEFLDSIATWRDQ